MNAARHEVRRRTEGKEAVRLRAHQNSARQYASFSAGNSPPKRVARVADSGEGCVKPTGALHRALLLIQSLASDDTSVSASNKTLSR